MRSCVLLAGILLSALMNTECLAADTPAHGTCARAAADPTEPDLGFPGVEPGRIDPYSAVLACQQASDEDPSDLPTRFRLARALLAADRRAEGMLLMFETAKAGYPPAQALYGTAYLTGNGTPFDLRLAREWLEKAAAAGNALAQNNIGTMYDRGLGLPYDPEEAVRWFKLAADQGYGQGLLNVANAYRYGHGVPLDLAKAAQWYRTGVAQGVPEAGAALGHLTLCGCGVARDVGGGLDLIAAAADLGAHEAYRELGMAYLRGIDIGPYGDRALALLEQGAELRYPEANIGLGHMYDRGVGVTRNPVAAYKHFLSAAQDLSPGLPFFGEAATQVAKALLSGKGVGADEALAERWLLKAARAGFVPGQTELVAYYLAHDNVEDAVFWAEQAAFGGDVSGLGTLTLDLINRDDLDRAEHFSTLMLQYGSAADRETAIGLLATIEQRRKERAVTG